MQITNHRVHNSINVQFVILIVSSANVLKSSAMQGINKVSANKYLKDNINMNPYHHESESSSGFMILIEIESN